ncbi:cyclic GMP-AMP synthase-like [Scyliorhinus canicula]|uniref:cyclic GMP-AMP synthase-like n=1 Tax=Scyliorhinus canicula TaxID=7830 RepID=UPI0018F7837C|nr:cyclic GMP-AMP synthase-like [Scyliorhinus canicula]
MRKARSEAAAAGAGGPAAKPKSAAPAAAVPANGPSAKRPGSSRAAGANPKGHPGKGSKERPRQSSCPNGEDSKSQSSPAPSRKSDNNHKEGIRRKNQGTGSSRAAGDQGTGSSRAAGDQGTGSGRAAGAQGTGSSRAAGAQGTGSGRAAGAQGTGSSRAAGAQGTGSSRAAGDKGTGSSRAAGDQGTGSSRAAGDQGTGSSRAAGDQGTRFSRAAGDQVTRSSRAAGAQGTESSRAAGDQVTRSSGALSSSEKDRNLNKVLRNVLEDLRIRSDQKSRAAKLVNEVVDHLLRSIRKDSAGCFAAIEKLASGSYYENVKISEPNEFDIMTTIRVDRIDFTDMDSEGAFYQVAFKRNQGTNPLSQFVCDGTLSAEKMICHLRKLIKEAVKTLSGHSIKVDRKKPGSPAVTLQIEDKEHGPISLDMVLALEVHSQSWPSSTTDGLKIENWLGTKVRKNFRMEPFYLVPKQPLDVTQGAQSQSHKVMWRISFSHIEKKMLLNHGNLKTCCENGSSKCCRKPCLKLLKHLIQKLKAKHPRILASVCSYHAKTTLFHACVKRPNDEMWSFEDLDICFLQLLDDFVEYLQATNLPHFFIPNYNLFKPGLFDSRCREVLLRLIETERNKDFVIFSGPN